MDGLEAITPISGSIQSHFAGLFPEPQEAESDRPGLVTQTLDVKATSIKCTCEVKTVHVSSSVKEGRRSIPDYQQQPTPYNVIPSRRRERQSSPAQRLPIPSPPLLPLEPHPPASPPAAPAAQQEQPPPNAAGPQPEAQDNHHNERQETPCENDPLLRNTGPRNRRKQPTQSYARFFILICAMICFLAGSAIIVAFFEDRYNTTPSAHQSRTIIQQGDIIILSTGENYCVSSESVTSLNVTEVLPLHSINIVALYKHQGDRSSLRNISSTPVTVSIPQLELTTGVLLRTIYAASYASVSFVVQILNIVPLNGFTCDDGSLTLYILGSDEDAECFDEQGKNCQYIERRSLNTDSGALSVASFQTFKPGYYLLYLLPKNVDITVAFNYTLQFDTFNVDDFTQPVCTIRAGKKCENITLRQNEGTVCFIASVVSSGSAQFFNLITRVLYRPLHLHDPTTKTLLAFGVIFILIFLICAMVLLVAGYKYHKVRT